MENLGEIDLAFLPFGGRGFTMNLSQAVQAAVKIDAKIVIPMHRFEADPEEFRKQVEYKPNIKVEPLQLGAMYQLQ